MPFCVHYERTAVTSYPDNVSLLPLAVDTLIASATGTDFVSYILTDLKNKSRFSRRLRTMEAGIRSWATWCEICGGEIGSGTSFAFGYFGLSPSVSFHQRYIIVCILILILSEGQAGKVWEPFDKAILCSCLRQLLFTLTG